MPSLTLEDLSALATEASQMHVNRSVPLTDAVVTVVKKANLNVEQVKRVVELTNVDAYLSTFKKMAGQDHRYVSFKDGPADAKAVLSRLNFPQDREKTAAWEMDDYEAPPEYRQPNSFVSAMHETFEAMDFIVKTASDREQETWTKDEQYKLACALKEAGEHCNAASFRHERDAREYIEQLYGEVKKASWEGVPLGQLVQAMSKNAPTDMVKRASIYFIQRLVQDGYVEQSEVPKQLEKRASGGLNMDHPIVQLTKAASESLRKLERTQAAADALHVYEQELRKSAGIMDEFVQGIRGGAGKALLGSPKGYHFNNLGDALDSKAGIIPKIQAAAEYGAKHTSEAARSAGEALGGPKWGDRAGRAAHFLTRNAPALAAGGVAYNALQSPTVQEGVTRLNASLNPLSQVYQRREALQANQHQQIEDQVLNEYLGGSYGFGY